MTSTPGNSDQPDPFAETQIGGPVPNLNKDQTPPADPFQAPATGNPFEPPATGNPFEAPAAGSFEPPVGNPFDPQPQTGQPYGQPQYGQAQYGAVPPYPGAPYQAGPAGAAGTPPDNSLVSAVLLTILSFLGVCSVLGIVSLVLGIVALVKANAVNTKWNMGDAAGAQQAADEAKKFSNIGWIVFGVSVAIFVILMIIGAAAG